jgi:hypothetical protein
MTSGAQARDSRFVEVSWVILRGSHQFRSLLLAPRVFLSATGILEDEVHGARDDSWRGCFLVFLLSD